MEELLARWAGGGMERITRPLPFGSSPNCQIYVYKYVYVCGQAPRVSLPTLNVHSVRLLRKHLKIRRPSVKIHLLILKPGKLYSLHIITHTF